MFSDLHEKWEHELVEKTKKETAKEILQSLLDCIYYDTFIQDYELDKVEEKIKEIAKQYGVELKEWNYVRKWNGSWLWNWKHGRTCC